METQDQNTENWTSLRVKRGAIVSAVLFGVLLSVGVVFYPILVPLFVSALMAYLLSATVDRMEQFGMQRSIASLAIIVIFMTLVSLLLTKIVPVIYHQVVSLVSMLPEASRTIVNNWVPVIETELVELGIMDESQRGTFFSVTDVVQQLKNQLQNGIRGLWVTGATLVGGVFNVVIIPVITFFLLNEKRLIQDGVRRLIPLDLVGPMSLFADRINSTLKSVINGQAIVAGILAVMYVIGLSITGLEFAVGIGVVAGICRIIPYLDVIVGGTLSALVLISDFSTWGQVFGVILVFVTVQSIDGMFVTPRIMGGRLGLHAGFVILAVITFANWFGFWGVLLAIPVIAILKTIFGTVIPFYVKSSFYSPAWYPAVRASVDDPDLPDGPESTDPAPANPQ